MKFFSGIILCVARWCIAAIFLFAGIAKLFDYEGTFQYMQSKGMTMIPVFLFAAAAVEIIGALSLIFGYKTRFGAIILLLFLIPTTVIFHDFWNLQGEEMKAQLIHFLSNIAIFGGLLYVLACGAGGCSCDRWCKPSSEK